MCRSGPLSVFNMTRSVVLLVCVSVVLPVLTAAMEDVQVMQILDMEDQWTQWKTRYGKSYSPKEEMYRRHVFYQHLKNITDHNAKYPLYVSYTRGLNQFSDMTVGEYRHYNKLAPRPSPRNFCNNHVTSKNQTLPAFLDWRTQGYVTPVKDQGTCGSGWAFSATGTLEGQHFKKTGTLLSLSEQQLIDCSVGEENNGCNGGLADNAYDYIMTQDYGLETEDDYPYLGYFAYCATDPSKEQAGITGCADVEPMDEYALEDAVAMIGPVAVVIDAQLESFQSYSEGVYSDHGCSSVSLNHAMLVVGYGTSIREQDYWIVKNSWGTDWGMSGYMWIARNKGNMCGVATEGSYCTV